MDTVCISKSDWSCRHLFPNEKSLERLVTALLSEVSDEWETGNIYLNMQY